MNRLLEFREYTIKLSGTKVRAQLWSRNGVLEIWDGFNWYPASVMEGF